ncbi:MAG: hypothetical protein OXC55_05485 [Chloroflexi bacterium]|nr:hypothetical protein [Chloroflexota bacterium]
MTTAQRLHGLETIAKEQNAINQAIVRIIERQDEQMRELRALHVEARQDARYTRRIWIAVAKKLELWDELEEDDLA